MKSKDKDFELQYTRLSYRRRFIRTLRLIPIGLIAIILVYWRFLSNFITNIITIIFIVAMWGQATYNYKKWKGGIK